MTTDSIQARPNGSRQQPAAPAKRRGKPWNPAGQLGIPTRERTSKSLGFEEENLAAGDGPKVVRSVEKAPFTTRFARERVTEAEIEKALRLRRPPNFERVQTALDKALAESEWHALDFYVEATRRKYTPRPVTLRYDDTPRGPEIAMGGDEREYRWRLDQRILAILEDRMPPAYAQFLDLLTWQVHPEFREGTPPSRVDIGKELLSITGRDRAEGGYLAWTKAIAVYLADELGKIAVELKRKKEAKEKANRDERKANGAAHFKVSV